jgi:hypothetical protein
VVAGVRVGRAVALDLLGIDAPEEMWRGDEGESS